MLAASARHHIGHAPEFLTVCRMLAACSPSTRRMLKKHSSSSPRYLVVGMPKRGTEAGVAGVMQRAPGGLVDGVDGVERGRKPQVPEVD